MRPLISLGRVLKTCILILRNNMALTPEEKAMKKIVSTLFNDAFIQSLTAGRVYASHISSIQEPVTPAISLFLIGSTADFAAFGYVDMTIQIDSWMPNKTSTTADVLALHKRIRDLLHRQNLTDSSMSLIVAQCSERSAGPLLYEEDSDLLHYPVIYSVRAS